LVRASPPSALVPYTTLFRSDHLLAAAEQVLERGDLLAELAPLGGVLGSVQAGHLGKGHVGDDLRLHLGQLIAGANLLFGLVAVRSEEHTSELQSLRHLVCRL